MKNTTNFEDILKDKYGQKGTPAREKYDAESLAFRLGVMLKLEQKKATSQELKEVRAIFRYPHSTN